MQLNAWLLGNVDDYQICKWVPLDIKSNVCFLMSTKALGHWKEALSDSMGSWKQTGTLRYLMETAGPDYAFVRKQQISDTTVHVIRYQYICKSSEDLRRIVIRLESNDGLEIDIFLVQYYFTGEEHTVRVNPHGNSTSKGTPYQKTSECTKERIKELCVPNSKPKYI